MLSKVLSAGLLGVNAYLVEVEVDNSPGMASWNTVGLPENSVKESRDRVIAAIRNSGYQFKRQKITINLAPAHIKKEGTAFDLPIAVALLAASPLFKEDKLKDTLILGELSLEGKLKPVFGVLPVAIMARQKKITTLIVPRENAVEAAVVGQFPRIFGAETLGQVVSYFLGKNEHNLVEVDSKTPASETQPVCMMDYSEIKGQHQAKRAIEVAAAGGHNILMIGSPGSGKTMLAQRLPSILSPMTFSEALDVTRVYSVLGLLPKQRGLLQTRPFRSPHHTISGAGLVGGGTYPRPGEVSLAHHGILFLDELPEFQKNVLEILRQPLESKEVTISRAAATLTFPARFMLVAAMNPCRCGYFGSPLKECVCTDISVNLYRNRLSGPLLDRIDIQIEVPAVRFSELAARQDGESSSKIRERVLRTRELQKERFGTGSFQTNGEMNGAALRKYCDLDMKSLQLLEKAVQQLSLSARAYHRILKVSRTIADLEGVDTIKPVHVSEAIQYRSLDRNSVG